MGLLFKEGLNIFLENPTTKMPATYAVTYRSYSSRTKTCISICSNKGVLFKIIYTYILTGLAKKLILTKG